LNLKEAFPEKKIMVFEDKVYAFGVERMHKVFVKKLLSVIVSRKTACLLANIEIETDPYAGCFVFCTPMSIHSVLLFRLAVGCQLSRNSV